MITISDVAKKAGVSIATVSNVVNKNGKTKASTEEQVQKVIDELGYIPNNIAKGLKTSHTNTIGIIAEDISSFSSPAIIDGICDYAEQHNYTINLCNLRIEKKVKSVSTSDYEDLASTESFKSCIRNDLNQLLTSRIGGLIYIGVYPRDVSQILPSLPIPVVYTYSYTQGTGCCVNYDDYQGSKDAVEFLIKNNHKRIALISGSINSIPTHKRMLGYQTALMDHKIPFVPEYVRTGKWHYEDGYNQCNYLLNLAEPPTAIFAMSDLMAYGAMNAAMDRGLRVPEDISIHGFDNLDSSAFLRPALTTVALPLRDMGLTTAKMMISLIENNPLEKNDVLLNCSHIKRKSVRDLI